MSSAGDQSLSQLYDQAVTGVPEISRTPASSTHRPVSSGVVAFECPPPTNFDSSIPVNWRKCSTDPFAGRMRRVPRTTTFPDVVTLVSAPASNSQVSPAGTVNPLGNFSPSTRTLDVAADAPCPLPRSPREAANTRLTSTPVLSATLPSAKRILAAESLRDPLGPWLRRVDFIGVLLRFVRAWQVSSSNDPWDRHAARTTTVPPIADEPAELGREPTRPPRQIQATRISGSSDFSGVGGCW